MLVKARPAAILRCASVCAGLRRRPSWQHPAPPPPLPPPPPPHRGCMKTPPAPPVPTWRLASPAGRPPRGGGSPRALALAALALTIGPAPAALAQPSPGSGPVTGFD